MINLLPGLRKFSETVFPKQKKLFDELSAGQKPHTLLITCSDSRIDPNLVTQTSPGELFVVRNAGNIVPSYGASATSEAAAIEFAIGLGVTNIVVCGHSQCGAMSALGNRLDLDQLPSVKCWLMHAHATQKRIERFKDPVDAIKVVEENVLVQIDNLKTHPSVSAALRNGTVHIFGWIYHFEDGQISVYDKDTDRYVPSTEVREDSAERFSL